MGILFSLLGSSSSVWVLLAKTVSQPPGIAITDPDKIVRAMDVFVVLANLALSNLRAKINEVIIRNY